jgi:hypothetical protein
MFTDPPSPRHASLRVFISARRVRFHGRFDALPLPYSATRCRSSAAFARFVCCAAAASAAAAYTTCLRHRLHALSDGQPQFGITDHVGSFFDTDAPHDIRRCLPRCQRLLIFNALRSSFEASIARGLIGLRMTDVRVSCPHPSPDAACAFAIVDRTRGHYVV